MPSTRVYVTVTDSASETQIAIRNISQMELTVSGEELTERFVRGDGSRNTEGSGLGLAIARSFTELAARHNADSSRWRSVQGDSDLPQAGR